LLLLNIWSTRAVYCSPLRGRLVEKLPTPVTGRLHGIAPTSVWIIVEPEQFCPAICPAVMKLRSGTTDDGKSRQIFVDVLLGAVWILYWINSGVTTEAARPEAAPERRISVETKKNV